MKKKIRRIIMAVLLVIFIGSVGVIGFVMKQYRDNDRIYAQASEEFTKTNEASGGEIAPKVVDFDALRQVNAEVVAWIYCEGTVIDYPVLQGGDNKFYLSHTYEKDYSVSGSIFADCHNRPGFADANTILYGHHMKNDSMFATLENWQDQQYYEDHPVMWLLTPEQDYKIELFSGYMTSARADTYTMIQEPGEEMDAYLEKALSQSAFQTDVELDRESRYVLLSTCAYVFDNARAVLHGKLVPAGSAGGTPLTGSGVEAGQEN